jgi:hypothetical protein
MTPTKRSPGRPKGRPKTGGRKRGTPNRSTAQNEAMRAAAERYLASIMDNPQAPKALRELAEKALALRRRG